MTDQKSDPKFVRESFTWRRMKRWQITTIALAVIVLLVLYFAAT